MEAMAIDTDMCMYLLCSNGYALNEYGRFRNDMGIDMPWMQGKETGLRKLG